jgi:hypothetical protein
MRRRLIKEFEKSFTGKPQAFRIVLLQSRSLYHGQTLMR